MSIVSPILKQSIRTASTSTPGSSPFTGPLPVRARSAFLLSSRRGQAPGRHCYRYPLSFRRSALIFRHSGSHQSCTMSESISKNNLLYTATSQPYSTDGASSAGTGTATPTDEAAALELIESAKRRAAQAAVRDYFNPSMRYIGIGSGTTIQYVVEAIKEQLSSASSTADTQLQEQHHNILFVPTGYQSRSEIEKRGLIAVPFDSLPQDQMLDVAFDGADEVDEDLNCVKGGGACLFQEKLVAMRSRKFVCVADYRKSTSRLLQTWPYIPVEVAPISVKPVLSALRALGSPNPVLRTLQLAKSGPLKTDQDFYIIKAPFPRLLIHKDVDEAGGSGVIGEGQTMAKTKEGHEGRVWEAGRLATAIKGITGVLEVGLFVGTNGPEAAAFKQQGSRVTASEVPEGAHGAVAGSMGVEGAGIMSSQGGQKPVAVYFGMEDGSVTVRKAKGAP